MAGTNSWRTVFHKYLPTNNITTKITNAVRNDTKATRVGAYPIPVWLSNVSVRARGVCSITAFIPLAIADPMGI
jgi:hypothetical protein